MKIISVIIIIIIIIITTTIIIIVIIIVVVVTIIILSVPVTDEIRIFCGVCEQNRLISFIQETRQ